MRKLLLASVATLVQAAWNSVCTLPLMWMTMVPGVGLANAPGSAGA